MVLNQATFIETVKINWGESVFEDPTALHHCFFLRVVNTATKIM